VKEVKDEDGELKLVVKGGEAVLPRVVEAAAGANIRIESMSIHKPDTGRRVSTLYGEGDTV
jgi:hypothetical protein